MRPRVALPGTPCWGSSSTCTSAHLQAAARSTSACSPPRSSSSRPTPASSGSRGWSTRWDCTARCPTRSDGCTRASERPRIGILLFGAVACVTIIPGQAQFLGNMYAFGAMLSFTIAHLSVIRLRVKQPDQPRPYRGPGTVTIAGRELPLFAAARDHRHGPGVRHRHLPAPRRRRRRRGLAGARDRGLHRLPSPVRASTCAPPPVPRGPNARRTSRSSATAPRSCRSLARTSARPRSRSAAKLIGEDGVRVRDLRTARPQSALARGRPGGRGGPGSLGTRERAHPGAARRHQDPHRPDPHAQPRARRSWRKPSAWAPT